MSAIPRQLPVEKPETKLRLFNSAEGDVEDVREGEAPAEPLKEHVPSDAHGSAGTSPSHPSPSPPTLFDLHAQITRLSQLIEGRDALGGRAIIPAPQDVESSPQVGESSPQVVDWPPSADRNLGGGVEEGRPGAAILRGEVWSLRDCYDSDFARNPTRRNNWGQYRTLLDKWETAWGGAGPDMRSLTAAQLQQAFESVAEWHTPKTWKENESRLVALLKACCRQTRRNSYGVPPGSPAPLNEDELPIWNRPPARWFESRPQPPKPRRGHQRSTLPLMSIAELDRVLAACDVCDDPIWWKVLIGWFWFCGMDITDTVINLTWRDAPASEGVDLALCCLHSRRSKTLSAIDIPLPTWLIDGLTAIKRRQVTQTKLFEELPAVRVFHRRKQRGDPDAIRKKLPKNFYTDRQSDRLGDWEAIWQRAGVAVRMPKQMRGVSISHWRKQSVQYSATVAGHSTRGNIALTHYVTFDDDFRRAAEQHPRPTLPLV